jgi:type II secretory pathway pseudopilin PulG
MAYDVFVSYSHDADGRLAPALQVALQQLAKPFFKLRALHIFLDKTGLPLTPALWPKIQEVLSQSQYFVLLASPEAANSEWVRKEIEYWLKAKGIDHFLIVCTGGDFTWDPAEADFDWKVTDALPVASLRGRFPSEPLIADLRPFKTVENLTLKHVSFAQEVARIAAPLRAMAPSDLLSEEVRQQQRIRTLTVGALLMMAILTVLGVWQAMVATQERTRAEEQAQTAVARRMGADAALLQAQEPAHLNDSILLAMESIQRLGALKNTYSGAYETVRKGASLLPLVTVAEVGSSVDLQGSAFSTDGRWLSTWDDTSLQVWDTRTWSRQLDTKVSQKILGVRFGNRGQWFAVWSERRILGSSDPKRHPKYPEEAGHRGHRLFMQYGWMAHCD